MIAYYNEIEPSAVLWLQAAMDAGHIAPGDIDTRPIQEVKADDLKGYTQCHFFAGIGGWSIALRMAGWPDDRPVWTGSCPCQPFSSAGRQKGKADDRHLWPIWERLIREVRPEVVFGEQVSSAEIVGTELETAFIAAVQRGDYAAANRYANRLAKTPSLGSSERWLDDVYQGLEAEGYAIGAAVLPACSVGKAHKRDRLWFVADGSGGGWVQRDENRGGSSARDTTERRKTRRSPLSCESGGTLGYSSCQRFGETRGDFQRPEKWPSGASTLGNTEHDGQPATTFPGGQRPAIQHHAQGENSPGESAGAGNTRDVADTDQQGLEGRGILPERACECASGEGSMEWLLCPDGKHRPIEPSIRLLVDGLPGKLRKSALHGYGNAIVPQVAAEFIRASEAAMAGQWGNQ